MNILFASDISFNYFQGKYPGDEVAKSNFAEIVPYFERADFSIVNLECTFGCKETLTPITKSGPNQIAAPEFIRYIEELSPDAASLANNHAGDFGDKPIYDTIKMLESAGVTHLA